MLLLLVWRHLAVYAEEGPAGVPNFGASIRTASAFDAQTFRQDASRRLAPVVQRLGSMVSLFSFPALLEIDADHVTLQAQDTLGLGWEKYEKYMDLMARRLKDCAGLHDHTPEESSEDGFDPHA